MYKCKSRIAKEKCSTNGSAVYEYSPSSVNERGLFVGYRSRPHLWAKCTNKTNIYEICLDECSQPDCHLEEYSYRQTNKRPYPHLNGSDCDVARIRVSSTQLDLVYIHNSKLQLVEVLCFLGSTMSLWFGLSVWSLYSFVKIAANKFKIYPSN